jgi:hypothetical protein
VSSFPSSETTRKKRKNHHHCRDYDRHCHHRHHHDDSEGSSPLAPFRNVVGDPSWIDVLRVFPRSGLIGLEKPTWYIFYCPSHTKDTSLERFRLWITKSKGSSRIRAHTNVGRPE